MPWVEIKDEQVRMYWKCEEEECPEGNMEAVVDPSYYHENGTPMCGCDAEMYYQRTEIHGRELCIGLVLTSS
jgi:hypothetical protein